MPFTLKDEHVNVPLIEFVYRPESPKEMQRLEMTRAWARALVVPEQFRVVGAAALAELNDMDLIITVDADRKVSGVLAVSDLMQLGGSDGIPRPDQDSLAIIRGRRPKLFWCKDGKHETTEDPCSQHPPA